MALALLAAALLAAAAPAAPGVFGTAGALDKLRPGDPLPPGRAIELSAARGECESAQIAVRAARPLAALTAEAPALAGPSALAPALYRVATVELAAPSGPDGARGAWPDPLVPVRDGFFGEPRRAFPVAVPAGRLQAIWVELCVPAGAAPGRYRGAVRLADGARALAEVPVRLEVWPFALPATSAHTVTFGLPTRVGTKALGRPDDPVLARALAAALLRHRVSPHGLSYDPPAGDCTAARCALDWSAYDAEVGPILDGTLVPGVRGTFADARVRARDWEAPLADQVALLRAWREHFQARGWEGALWLYTLDEPKPGELPALARRARAAREAGVRTFVTSEPRPGLEGLVEAWAPNLVFFDGKGPAAFPGARRGGSGGWDGRPFWYASCLSHGCDELPAAGRARERMVREFAGWPGYEVDRPGASVRALGWLAERAGVAGELYYQTLEAWTREPWRDVRAFAGNGDGTLLYPGLPGELGGANPFPVESIRLKLVRDAIEDRELAALARRAGLGGLVDRLAARLAPSLRGFPREARPWLAAHDELGRALAEALSAPRPRGGDAAARRAPADRRGR
ncbi:DUF4091 domain-containing protein [Anaeromyxobacter diazotrophicus]|uniref:Glycoside hydrolase 123 C-terminal domain-containing protein n=1 Tax=Anaeromyxobacter diazotrophicus TaxID=2590199 RepID=A0A7I9VQ33_9BACT|nr:DUF4091 domain-containing protein [Anaeromyxobacter diazotrophicus]GEJ58526.1 hypothetical protein AMYX_32670 [Anaeromyxobacter diazotrophicus]